LGKILDSVNATVHSGKKLQREINGGRKKETSTRKQRVMEFEGTSPTKWKKLVRAAGGGGGRRS